MEKLADDLPFLRRILYSTSKTIIEHVKIGQDYDNVKKVFSISILFFNLDIGKDYLYYGKSELIGVHTKDRFILGSVRKPQSKRLEDMKKVFGKDAKKRGKPSP